MPLFKSDGGVEVSDLLKREYHAVDILRPIPITLPPVTILLTPLHKPI
jgi:hypothetical protein